MKPDPLILDHATEPPPAQPALPLPRSRKEPLIRAVAEAGYGEEVEPPEPTRTLVPADFARRSNVFDAALGWAYRLGVPGAVLAAPLRKPARLRVLATVASPLARWNRIS